MGKMVMTDSVMKEGQLVVNCPFARKTSSTRVVLERLLRNMFGAMKSFQIHMVLKMTEVVVMGFINGRMMEKKILPTLAPSTIAASLSGRHAMEKS